MKKADLMRWAISARPGQSVVYFHGFLAPDCDLGFGARTQHGQTVNRALRATARALSDAGVVNLVQRRFGAGVYDYIAQRTHAPAPRQIVQAAAALRHALAA